MINLAADQLGNSTSRYTFVILVDGSACGKALQESTYWREWRRTAETAGWEFVFATSQSDSAGLIWAARLDSVDAPVLVIPGCDNYVLELGLPRGVLPLKCLLDSAGSILEY